LIVSSQTCGKVTNLPIDAVLPAFLIALLGYVAGHRLNLDVGTLSRVCLYILTPSLAFNSLATSSIPLGDAWRLAIGGLLMPFAFLGAFTLMAKAFGWDRELARAMSLPALFSNAGNYGLPVLLFALGQEGMDLGVIVMGTQTILMNTLGVYLAASSKMDPKKSLAQVFRMPSVYAITLGILVRALNIPIPPILGRPVGLLAGATVPVYLLVLGLQLVGVKGDLSVGVTSAVVSFRLVIAPIIAGLVGYALGLRGLPFKALVLEQAMPSAVNVTILAKEFGANPKGVSRITLISTIGSVLTLTVWIMLIRNL
jgi:predicted permease